MLKDLIARNINTARTQSHMSQRKLALEVGVHFNQVCRWESGKSAPELEKLEEVAKVFGRDPAWFFHEHEANESEVIALARPLVKKLVTFWEGQRILNPQMEALPDTLTQLERGPLELSAEVLADNSDIDWAGVQIETLDLATEPSRQLDLQSMAPTTGP